MIRLADFIIKFLEKKKINSVFTVSGGGSIFLCDALYKSKKIQYISHHHEQAASFAAESFARTNGKIGCCIVTTGPGGTNVVTGVSSAWIDSVPVLFISGQVFLNQTIQNTKKRQIGVQEINIIDIVKPITKYSKMIQDPKMINYELEKAYSLATSGRPGPVFLDIPADIQNFYFEEKLLLKKKYKIEKQKFKFNSQINKLVKELKKSKRPLIHLGHGLKLSKSHKIVKNFFKKYRIPFVVTWNADDLISSSNKMYMGKPGAFGERGSNFIVQNCDFYLSIGSRLPYMVTGYNAKKFARRAKFKCMVDIDEFELKKKDLKINLKINCDAQIFLSKIYKKIQKYNSPDNWIKYCNQIRKKYPILLEKMKNQKRFINSYYFVDKLSQNLSPNTTIVTDMGFSFTSAHQAFKNKDNQSFFTNSGHAPMGWGLPAAIGAYFSKKNNQIICLTGDGGFQMNIQELSTIMHHKIPVKIFIFNNKGYLTIKQTQILGFKSRIMGADKRSGLSFPNYAKIANANSLKYFILKNQGQLRKNIKKILNLKKPVICELNMDPGEEQIPKAINRRDNNGKTIPTEFEDMYPFLPEKELGSNNF
jgi:acetolactate synthase-1/2/3 large subunit